MSTWRITTKYSTNKVVSFYPDVFLGCVPVLIERPDGHYCIENGMVTDNVGLNFSEPDSIICQNHVYDLLILFLREYGPPSSFQVYLINLVFFFFEHVFLLLQVFLFLPLGLYLWHALWARPPPLPPSPPLWIPPLTLN